MAVENYTSLLPPEAMTGPARLRQGVSLIAHDASGGLADAGILIPQTRGTRLRMLDLQIEGEAAAAGYLQVTGHYVLVPGSSYQAHYLDIVLNADGRMSAQMLAILLANLPFIRTPDGLTGVLNTPAIVFTSANVNGETSRLLVSLLEMPSGRGELPGQPPSVLWE